MSPSLPEPDDSSTLVLRPPSPAVNLDSSLAAKLAEELARRWNQGDQVRAEEFLNRHPDLWHHPELAIEIVYEEVCQRQNQGQTDYTAAVLDRFPQWRGKLEVMLECHRLLEAPVQQPRFPGPGETLAGYRILKQLGRGAGGRVFLAQQADLADRSVVLKLTSFHGQEHLNLARLQHTHIVPLYAAQDDPKNNLRILCMPYFGGGTLEGLLQNLAGCPAEKRTGEGFQKALEGLEIHPAGPAQAILGRLSYVQAMCWIATCLADALYYAQEIGLIHLDVKPSNILLAADGQPMLLDFHLAQKPLYPGEPLPEGMGGTLPYMAPEQHDAMHALEQGKPIPLAIDQRADVYGLGAVLFEALGGKLTTRPGQQPSLYRLNPQVSRGLSDIIDKCLATRPEDRYSNAALLAKDLRCHLSDQPLQGVPNRSWAERWHKWRRRHPATLQSMVLLLVILGAVGALAYGALSHWKYLSEEVEIALEEGHKNWQERERFTEAIEQLKKGLERAHTLPWQGPRIALLEEELSLAQNALDEDQRQRTLRELHDLAEQVRGMFDLAQLPAQRLAVLNRSCQEFWNKRKQVRKWLESARTREAATDLLDLVLFTANLQIHLAGVAGEDGTRRQALQELDEAETLFGSSAVLSRERQRHRLALKLPPSPDASMAEPGTMWEYLALGRMALLAGDLTQAAEYLQKALDRQPHGFWPNFYQGQCAYRLGRYAEAVAAFSVCIGAGPELAGPYFNRALAYAGLGQRELAVHDYDQVLHLDPAMAGAALNRGLLHFQARRFLEAEKDLYHALQLGTEEAPVYFQLAKVQLARQNVAGALQSLERVLALTPNHEEARTLCDRLRSKR